MTFRQDILGGRTVIGPWMFAPNPMFIEIAATAGVDFVIIDLEHGEATLRDVPNLLRAGRGGPTALLVRSPSHDPATLSKLIDFGADGVLVPKVNNAVEAKVIVDACRYPPVGQRGLAPASVRASRYGFDTTYRQTAAEFPLVAVQIETLDGVANMQEIASVDGVDMIFIGPNDLSGALGYAAVDEKAAAHVADIIGKVAATGKKVGAMPYPGYGPEELKAIGVSFMAGGSDLSAHRDFLKSYKTSAD
jgi:4-hydroxy-2-oxoheptanedioate aldolase